MHSRQLTQEELAALLEVRERRIALLESQLAEHVSALAKQGDVLAKHVAALAEQRAQVSRLEAEVKRLSDLLNKRDRDGKRQAAPFSKGPPRPDPKTPGRKPGDAHGRHAHREPPRTPPDEIISVPLPRRCSCGGAVQPEGVRQQHQIELPRKPLHRRFDIQQGRCLCCGLRVEGRDERQTSDGIGATACGLGPDAKTAIALLKTECGLSYGKIASFMDRCFHISLTPGGAARIVQWAARRCKPVFDKIAIIVRRSIRVTPDESGWRVGGRSQWLWTFVSPSATLYFICASRGVDVLKEVLGMNYRGGLTHDGWPPYDALTQATHQQCLAHLLRRSRELMEQLTPAARWFPREVKELLQDSLRTRDHWRVSRPEPEVRRLWRRDFDGRLRQLIGRRIRDPDNLRFANHLTRHVDQIFTFLEHPHIPATNHEAERAIRPAVVNRKVFGGNRTEAGARAQEVLCSVLRTCQQRACDAYDYIANVLRTPFRLGQPITPIAMPAR